MTSSSSVCRPVGEACRAARLASMAGVIFGTVLAGVLFASCAGDPKPAPQGGELPPVDSSLRALQGGEGDVLAAPQPAPLDDPADAWSRAALDLQAVLDGAAVQPGTSTPPSAAPGATPPGARQPPADTRPPESADPAPMTPDEAAPLPGAAPEVPLTPREEIDSLARGLASALRREASSPGNPFAPVDAMRLAMLESVLPGAAGADLDLDPQLLGVLAPIEAQHVRAARDLARAWTAATQRGTLDDAPGALATAAQQLRPASGSLRTTSALCQRVSGYGAYVEFPGGELIAGRGFDVIVYTELEGFADRSVASGDNALPGDLWTVDVSQELTLYHDPSDNLQAWHQPRSRVISTSRRHRLEFYLVNQVRLPANLTVGRYRLKVVTRDETSGAVSESWVSVAVVPGTGNAAAGTP